MITLLSLVTLSVGVVLGVSAQARDCSDSKALAAERDLDDLKTWADLHATFRKFQGCDDGAIAEGWDDFVARMLARNWRTIADLQRLVARDSAFRLFVMRHISETADGNDLRQVLSNARDHCPRSARRLCVQIAAAARNALPNP
jgi:phytoene dehydrogenase-like protein